MHSFVTFNDQEFLLAGSRFISDAKDLREALTGLVKMAASTSGSDRGSLYLLDENTGILSPYILWNLPPTYTVGCSTVALGKQCCGRAALHKVPWFVEDMWTDPLFIDCKKAAMNSGIRAGFSIPVLDSQGKCLGSLASHFEQVHRPDADTVKRFELIARVIAQAIEADRKKAAAGRIA